VNQSTCKRSLNSPWAFAKYSYEDQTLRTLSKRVIFTLFKANSHFRWTAVVRGAAIYGIEKADHPALTICKTCPRSYGIMLNQAFSRSKHGRRDLYTDLTTNRVMVRGQMAWLIKKGDLVLSDEPKEAEHSFSFKILPNDAKLFPFAIYEYPDDDLPERYETAQNGMLRSWSSTNNS
jgi:hypothetical protein